MTSLLDQAIQAALDSNWEKAVDLNTSLLKHNPQDTDALNRLAYAQAQIGNFEEACANYHKLLALDPYNHLAKKNLEKFQKAHKICEPDSETHHADMHIDPDIFLADAEKTRIVKLVNLASKNLLTSLTVGESVLPVQKGYELQIKTHNDEYIGTLPDDIGRTLIQKLERKRACDFLIKDVQENSVSIYIKWHQ